MCAIAATNYISLNYTHATVSKTSANRPLYKVLIMLESTHVFINRTIKELREEKYYHQNIFISITNRQRVAPNIVYMFLYWFDLREKYDFRRNN